MHPLPSPSPAPDLAQLDRWLAEDVGGRFEVVGPCRLEDGRIRFNLRYDGEEHIKSLSTDIAWPRENWRAMLNATEAALKHRQAARQ